MDVGSFVNLIPAVLGLSAQSAAVPLAGGTGVLERAANPVDGPWWAILIPVLPLLGAVLCCVTAALRVKTKLPAWITVGCLGLSFLITVALYFQGVGGHAITVGYEWINFSWGVWEDEPGQAVIANFAFYIDSLTLLWMLFVTGLGTLIALYASEYMASDVGKGYSRFFFAFSLFVFSMSCLVMADNLFLLYLGWEGVGLCSYLLIGYFYTKPSAVAAAKKAFIVNRIGDLGLALGIMLIFVKFGTLEYATLFANADFQQYLGLAREGRFGEIPGSVQAIAFLIMVGAFGKSAQFPLYVWLPDAMEGPTPVSALIHAATMVTAGVFLIARTYWIFQLSEWALPVVAWVGCITALLAATIGMAQFDIKRIMAYSTVSQLGFMFAGLGVFTAAGAGYHVFTHAFFKALLFLACGAVMHGFAGQLDLRKLSGVQFMPGWKIVGFTMLIGCLNLAGFPLITSGFFSKDMILAEAFTTIGPGYQLIGWLLLFTAGLTAYYTFRVYFRVFVGPVHYEPGDEHAPSDGAGHLPEEYDESAHALPHTVAEPEKFAEEAEQPTEAGGHYESAQGRPHAGAGHAEHEHFHPHAPGWAINTVLVMLAVLTFVAIVPYFMGPHGGWVAGLIHGSTADWGLAPGQAQALAGYEQIRPDYVPHGAFLGFDPHVAMYFVSAVVGIFGILVAAILHGPLGVWGLKLGSRSRADVSRADALVPKLGPIPRWAQNKWYVDEFYDFLIRTPLWVISHIFHLIDKIIVDGLVGFAGYFPRGLGASLRPAQSGQLHGYAVGMAGGAAFILFIVIVVVVMR